MIAHMQFRFTYVPRCHTVTYARGTYTQRCYDSVNWIEHRTSRNEHWELCAFAWVIIYEEWQSGRQADMPGAGTGEDGQIGMKNLHFVCHKIAIKIHLSRFNWKLLGLRSEKVCVQGQILSTHKHTHTNSSHLIKNEIFIWRKRAALPSPMGVTDSGTGFAIGTGTLKGCNNHSREP